MDTSYEKFEVSDFLKDKSFLMWKFFPDHDSMVFWNDFLIKYPYQKDNIERARQILDSVKIQGVNLTETDREDLSFIYENTKKLYLRRKQTVRRLSYVATAAACIILLTLLPFFYYQYKDHSNKNIVVSENKVQHSVNDIQLILGTQDKMILSQNATIQLNEKREIEIISKKEAQHSISKIASIDQLNTLIVPKGRRSSLTLPDGTQVWVNSGSSISFPSEFDNRKREISLVDGEIYIEVAKDKTKPFFVNTSFGKIAVHGTKFNVTAYSMDEYKYVVLAEGSISVCLNTAQDLTLSPNQKLNIQDSSSEISEVNPYNYICWKDGIMQFSNEKLGTLLLRLSRHYGVNFDCDELLSEKSCTGKMVLFDDLDEVLETLTDIFPIQYIKEDGEIKIVVKP